MFPLEFQKKKSFLISRRIWLVFLRRRMKKKKSSFHFFFIYTAHDLFLFFAKQFRTEFKFKFTQHMWSIKRPHILKKDPLPLQQIYLQRRQLYTIIAVILVQRHLLREKQQEALFLPIRIMQWDQTLENIKMTKQWHMKFWSPCVSTIHVLETSKNFNEKHNTAYKQSNKNRQTAAVILLHRPELR